MTTEKTNIYQSCDCFRDGKSFYYFQVLEELPKGYVRVRGLGELEIKSSGERTWKPNINHNPDYPDYPYPIAAKPRYWKGVASLEGDGRILGGRVLRTRHGGSERSRTNWMSLIECHPPPEYYQ
jgi:hypothetical protein